MPEKSLTDTEAASCWHYTRQSRFPSSATLCACTQALCDTFSFFRFLHAIFSTRDEARPRAHMNSHAQSIVYACHATPNAHRIRTPSCPCASAQCRNAQMTVVSLFPHPPPLPPLSCVLCCSHRNAVCWSPSKQGPVFVGRISFIPRNAYSMKSECHSSTYKMCQRYELTETRMHTRVHRDTHAHTRTRRDTYAHPRTRRHIHAHTRTQRDTHAHTRTHRDTHAHTRTHSVSFHMGSLDPLSVAHSSSESRCLFHRRARRHQGGL